VRELKGCFNVARKYQITYELSGITLGCFLFAFGTNCLLTPSSLLAGGLGGVCAIFYHLFEWPMGIQYFVYNIPLLFLGYIHVGKKFIIYTVFSVIVSSLFLEWIPVRLIWTKDILLCCIYGAIISGSGAAIILRLGGSVGGLDILSRVIAKYTNFSIGKSGLIFSASIVTISALIFDIQLAMYTILSFFVGTKTYDAILNIAEKNVIIIVTNEGEELASLLTAKLNREVNSWKDICVYSEKKKTVLLCLIIELEWMEVTHAVKSIDPGAVILSLPTKKTFGKFNLKW
jgi:uncharacterized membrane-anchored protein YitT (DUF2179 family)